jgi:hypothetical protein
MLLAKGLFQAALPLALAVAGGSIVTQIAKLGQDTTRNYAVARHDVRHALHTDWQPESNAPRSSGEIECWQRRDRSVRDSEVTSDYQGNIYVQDAKNGRLRVVKLETGFKLDDDRDDWMSRRLIDQSKNASHIP